MSNDGGVNQEHYEPLIVTAVPDAEMPWTRRATAMSTAGLLASALIATLGALPAPYAVGQPGPTFDILGDLGDTPMVIISGAPVYPSTGELRITTVSVIPASDRSFTMGRVIQAWFTPYEYVTPEERVFGKPEDREAHQEATSQQWVSSQENATVAALEALGMEVPARMRVAGVGEDSDALGKLLENDIIVAIDGNLMVSYTDLVVHMAGVSPGDDVSVTVVRDSAEVTASVATTASSSGSALMGIFVDPAFDLPVDVYVALESVGGPSAGMMFSLAIMERLTPGDMLNGVTVAGTGGITIDGQVEPMGGIVQKLRAARQAGSEYFLLPGGNCADATGHIPGGLVVVPVDTLESAFQALRAIGSGATAELPRCEQSVAGWSSPSEQ